MHDIIFEVQGLLWCRPNNNRSSNEQHPFHLHGYHFWVLGTGIGVYSEAANSASLNTVNPVYRDTVSVLKNGWAVIRFKVCQTALPEQLIL